MRAGIVCLVLAYMLSQFFRAFLAVLTPVLKTGIGATPEDLAAASGLYFLTFALMQIPVGSMLDRVGPRRTTAALFAIGGGGGALVFSFATNPLAIKIAMAMIGVGCAPVLMASYYIFARSFSPKVFGTLAGAVLGFGSLGNIASSLPMAWAVQTFGWRETLFAISALTLLASVAILTFVRDPERIAGPTKGSILDLLKMPALWLILPMMAVNYMPAAGLRGLWIGPYYTDVFHADAAGIGRATLAMGLAMVAGNFAYGPLDRVLRTRKWLVFIGNILTCACLFALAAYPNLGGWRTMALFAGVGFFGATFAMIMAHGRAFFPPHLIGRGVTLMNLFGIGLIGIAQIVTGRIHAALTPNPAIMNSAPPSTPYVALFLFFGVTLLIGSLIYAFSKDRTD